MSKHPVSRSQALEQSEDVGSSPGTAACFGDVVAARFSRREFAKGALAVAVIRALGADAAPARAAKDDTAPSFHFPEVAAGSDEAHHVAEGYDADILLRWGDPVLPGAPPFDPGAQTAAAQGQQFGYNNDFIAFFPLDEGGNRGLLVVNHEYTSEELMFAGLGRQDQEHDWAGMTPELADIEKMAHGGSVLEIERKGGKWAVVNPSRYARRITAETEMTISGPAAGHPKLRTPDDPSGRTVKGMLNNCAGAATPWGTWLTCEENTNYYFSNKAAAAAHPFASVYKRYGVPGEFAGWHKYDPRFDIAKAPNEPHRFGWVVEIDPFEPNSVPVKRTALGRFKHEGAGNIVNNDGRFVVYQGDDERFDYVYKFVTRDPVDLANKAANKDILDHGTLYVARFNADGSGRWMPLVHGTAPLTPERGFADQGDVVIWARVAADFVGATRMDRPEDIEVNSVTGKAYLMLTNNTKRTAGDSDAANPRAANAFGHIVEITPDGGDHAAETFRWDILVRCGDPAIAEVGATFNPATSKDGWFGMPDNGACDALGRLWITTDGNSAEKTGRCDGVWAMETSGPLRGTSRLFYRVPVGAELCGPAFTPDLETFFVAVQHPGESPDDAAPGDVSTFDKPMTRWPDFDPKLPPRPAVVAITRRGGGKIGV